VVRTFPGEPRRRGLGGGRKKGEEESDVDRTLDGVKNLKKGGGERRGGSCLFKIELWGEKERSCAHFLQFAGGRLRGKVYALHRRKGVRIHRAAVLFIFPIKLKKSAK